MDDTSFIEPLSKLRTNYWMVRQISKGSFGKVYLVKHKKLLYLCAAKHQHMKNSDSKRLSRREASILKKISGNENIVRYIDYFEENVQSVILMDYLEEGELFKIISSSNYELTESKCQNFARQILKGVDYIHQNCIIHLDLKPQNIVLSAKDAKLKIIDFGLARYLNQDSIIPISVCGTLEFIAPEVLLCSFAGPFSDMWSLGVIFYMMVSGGFSPFWSGNEIQTQKRILRGLYSFDNDGFASVSPKAKDCIKRLLTRNERDRGSASQILTSSWLSESYLDTLRVLETKWMRKYLARRRWYRLYNAIKALIRLSKIGNENEELEHEVQYLEPYLEDK